jgi:MFS family permease
VAVGFLQASPLQLGLIGVAQSAPFLLLALFAGMWVDRVHRRPILVAADLGRGAILVYLPIAAFFGFLRIEHLYALTFLLASLTLVFDIAHIAFLPTVVRHEELAEGNSKLELSQSVVSILGPGLAGSLFQLASGPLIILGDAVSFFCSALLLRSIRRPEEPPAPKSARRSGWREIGEGLRLVWADSRLRSIALRNATFNLFAGFPAIYLLYLTQELALPPVLIGLVFAAGGVGALVGTGLAGPLSRRLGIGWAMVGAATCEGLASILTPLAAGPLLVQLALLVTGQFVLGVGGRIYGINQTTLRQTLIPASLHGRVNATIRFLVFGATPVGSILGGVVAETLGLRGALALVAIGMAGSSVWILASPIRSLRDYPSSRLEALPVRSTVTSPT